MARYYFHFWSGSRYEVDETGVEFVDVESAFLDVFSAARSIAIEFEREGKDPSRLGFDILDCRGQRLLTLPFSEVLGAAIPPPRARQRPRPTLLADVRGAIARARMTVAQSRALVERSRAQARLRYSAMG